MKGRAEIIADWRAEGSYEQQKNDIVALMQIGAEYGRARTTISQLLQPDGVTLTPLPWPR
jgi:hypothetical protein